MRTFALFCLLIFRKCFAEYASANYFCPDMHRQQIVDISQLEGMWYLIEKLVHTEERHQTIRLTSCPVIHISEDRTTFTTRNPLYKFYDSTYGAQYPYNTPNVPTRNPTDPRTTFVNEQDFIKQNEEYDRKTTYDHERRRANYASYMKRHFSKKGLKIYMSDGSSSIEHYLQYNTSNPGFWTLSGSDEAVQDNIKHFAGTTLVLKAVGNHLVLHVCQSSREVKELYTMILSRENYLDSWDVHSVHGMLNRQGLRTTFVEKTCNGAESLRLTLLIYSITDPGLWTSFDVDEGTSRPPSPHGTVRVLKAVGNHLVLIFCLTDPDPLQLFTMILSREEFMDGRILHSVRGLLRRQGMTVKAIEQACNGTAAFSLQPLLVALSLIVRTRGDFETGKFSCTVRLKIAQSHRHVFLDPDASAHFLTKTLMGKANHLKELKFPNL
ncbi:hypothetical protein D910_04356 [Dendroctonus ponderosae]|uniref:Lipocalin/cytosolic fatty-acid binding domain-containing protein n=1 Tax=Dendroctonus ponderosae TaxID=77166 RepID=U4U3Q7_DENPD|nr:hypothetical protein D910_04356 [Dendroctonus ponderosae]